MKAKLLEIYDCLEFAYGPQQWWPGDTPFEVIVGAILTQSAAWTNVEKCIDNLKAQDALSPKSLREMPLEKLAQLVYPSGYYNAKAAKVKAFVDWLGDEYGDDLDKAFAPAIPKLRENLLSIHGVGEETADSIILYAAYKPIFVIDAYTRRIMDRLFGRVMGKTYGDYQKIFMNHLPHDERLFNEYHALFVCHGKDWCKKTLRCEGCCLGELCVARSVG